MILKFGQGTTKTNVVIENIADATIKKKLYSKHNKKQKQK